MRLSSGTESSETAYAILDPALETEQQWQKKIRITEADFLTCIINSISYHKILSIKWDNTSNENKIGTYSYETHVKVYLCVCVNMYMFIDTWIWSSGFTR